MDELENLAGQVAATDAKVAGAVAVDVPVDPDAPPPPPGIEEQVMDCVNMLSGLLVGYAPECGAILTSEAKQMSAAVLVPVFEKYNWSMMALPCEVVAAFTVGPLIYRCAKVVAAKIQADRGPVVADGKPQPSKQTEEVAPGAPVHAQMGLYQ